MVSEVTIITHTKSEMHMKDCYKLSSRYQVH